MSSYLVGARSVADYGCGKEWLRDFLEPGVEYFPIDYKARSAETIVCNFNDWEFPSVVTDAGFVSGCLEYIRQPEWFVEQLASHSELVVMSYCTVDEHPLISRRRQNGWINHLSEAELVSLCLKFKLELVIVDRTIEKNPIFVFKRAVSLSEWGVLCYRRSPFGDVHNLGDYIQSLAAAMLAGFDLADAPTVDREQISKYAGRPLRIMMNGWFSHSCNALPASPQLAVEVLSFHMALVGRCGADKISEITNWLKQVGPIGCRDEQTFEWARGSGIPAYESGCITPLVGAEFANAKRTDAVLIVDPWLPPRRSLASIRTVLLALVLDPRLVGQVVVRRKRGLSVKAIFDAALFVGNYSRFIPKRVLQRAKWRTHQFRRSCFTTEKSVFSHAREILAEYSSASLVVTRRIHAALPCFGMGTPVLFVHGGDEEGRFGGLIERFTTVRLDRRGIPCEEDVARLLKCGFMNNPIGHAARLDEGAMLEMRDLLNRHRKCRM